MSPTEPARLPPTGLHGLEPGWSRLVTTADGDGVARTWHVLDNWTTAPAPRLTLLCVHGNPSWSYLFRDLVRNAPADVRVVAVDHLDMGFSERTDRTHRLATRVDDLARVSAALEIDGPTVTVAHDWGGPISLGWALQHRDQLRGVVLMNTAVHQPEGSPAPSVIRLVRSKPLLHPVTTASTAFIRGAFALSDRRLPTDVRAGFLAPYATAHRRLAIGEFVADIPLEPDHPSAATLDGIAAGLADLSETPVLLLWGAADRVFSDLYLHDLESRLPHADVHRYPTAGHFVSEDTNCLDAVLDWTEHLTSAPAATAAAAVGPSTTLLDASRSAPDGQLAVAEMSGARDEIDVTAFDDLVRATASGFVEHGISPGDRVALMIPPGIDLAATLLACWRVGAVVVLVDAGLGPKNMSAAMRSAYPDHLIGIPKALAAARVLRWPGRPICTEPLGRTRGVALGASTDLPALRRSAAPLPRRPGADELAAIAFTSGATGPSKGVQYSHAALAAQRDAVAATYDITPDDRLVAAFAPFALFGPLLGIPSVVPDMDVTAPATLTASALGDAVDRIAGTVVFASPAALVNVIATSDELSVRHRHAFEGVRLVLSAGAPVRASTLREAAQLFPNATAATPYGMTECLPVTNITLDEIDAAASGDGVCVGRSIDGTEVAIRQVDEAGRPAGQPSTAADVAGEILVRGAHQRRGYDRLWHTTHLASVEPGWHATGDVGRLDTDGRLWVGGRLGHLITAPDGPVMPVRIEQAVERLPEVDQAAAVGIGPAGTQQLAVIVQRGDTDGAPRLADPELHDRIRSIVPDPVAAVLEVAELPVDRRHNSKVDRGRLAAWAAEVLAGGRVTAP